MTTEHQEIEVLPTDDIESLARKLIEVAPAWAVYDGVEVRVEVGQVALDVVKRYVDYRQSADIRRRLGEFAVSNVEIVAADSPGPGGTIDPKFAIQNPRVGTLYVLWERLPNFAVGNVTVVLCGQQNNAMVFQMWPSPIVAALGSLLVEHSYRHAAAEARTLNLERQVAEVLATLGGKALGGAEA
jgi:hypothetical protein